MESTTESNDSPKTGYNANRLKASSSTESRPTQANKQVSSVEPSRQSLAQSLIASNKSRAKFQNWLKAKHSDGEKSDGSEDEQLHHKTVSNRHYESSNYSDNTYTDEAYRDHKGTGHVNVLKVPSNRSPGFASPDVGWNSDDETGEITAATLLSPEDFDARADDIIAKVKGDMALTTIAPVKNSHRTVESAYHSVASKPLHEEPVPQGESGLSSHICPTCDKLMMPPNASPMLLIPCGHTLCNSCCVKAKFCAICGCSTQSSTLNIMLQQIITNFHTKQTHRQSAHKAASKQKIQNNYQEEYQNLLTRQEILQEESENIANNLKKLTKKLDRDQQQVTSIQRKEEDIEKKIEELQKQLKELSEHRQEYEKNCYTLEVQTKQEKNRLILVQDSLTSVQQQIEKVKLLAEDGY